MIFVYRFCYEKLGSAAYISHLDLGQLIERSLRRAAVPVAYSEGYNPHTKLSFGPALALGCESICEYIDISLTMRVDITDIIAAVNAKTPPGLNFLEGVVLPERHNSLINDCIEAHYQAMLHGNADPDCLERFIAAEEVYFERNTPKGRKVIEVKQLLAARPTINFIGEGCHRLIFSIKLDANKGSIKPNEFVSSVFGKELSALSTTRRTKLLLRVGA